MVHDRDATLMRLDAAAVQRQAQFIAAEIDTKACALRSRDPIQGFGATGVAALETFATDDRSLLAEF